MNNFEQIKTYMPFSDPQKPLIAQGWLRVLIFVATYFCLLIILGQLFRMLFPDAYAAGSEKNNSNFLFLMFFASSALYPLWRVQEGSPLLYYLCLFNPFTHAVELIRFALYGQTNWISLAVVGGCTTVFMVGAIYAYDPSRGLARRGPAGGET